MRLSNEFLEIPLAHRGLHDQTRDCPENSRTAVRAAVEAGYGVEIDVQASLDGTAIVFHDRDLARLTGRSGSVRETPALDLRGMCLLGGRETIPSLREILGLIAGRAPLLIEIKDRDGRYLRIEGTTERAVADELRDYSGPAAVMSFHPGSVGQFGRLAPGIPRGLVGCDFENPEFDGIAPSRRQAFRDYAALETTGASFVSHDWRSLGAPAVASVRERGADILCWTVRSPAEELVARRTASNITFEGYRPDLECGRQT